MRSDSLVCPAWRPSADVARRAAVGSFFLILFLVGLGCYRDYGIGWDEPIQRRIGAVSVAYAAPSLLAGYPNDLPRLGEFSERDYGVAFEAPAVALEILFGFEDTRDIYMFRHLLNFLVCFAGVFAVYRLARRRFQDWRLGLLAALFLVLTPRLFAESFYNSKDTIFLSVFAIALYTTISFVLKPGIRSALLNALPTALAIDVRVMGVLLVLVSVTVPLLKVLRGELRMRPAAWALLTYLIAVSLCVVAMWPYLWADPLGNFAQAFRNMARYRWDGEVLYRGVFMPATDIPWHYALTWIVITTPVLYLALFAVGFFATLRRVASRGLRLWAGDAELQDIVFAGLVVVPVAAVILLNSVLYDGWRHLYFIYPMFLLLAVRGWAALWNHPAARGLHKGALAAVTSAFALYIAGWMWNAHPLQNVYFNTLAGNYIRTQFDMDYWALGDRMALEYILANDPSPILHIGSNLANPIQFAAMILTPEEQGRLQFAEDRTKPFYFVTNYRGVKPGFDTERMQSANLFYEVRRSGEAVLSVFKLNAN